MDYSVCNICKNKVPLSSLLSDGSCKWCNSIKCRHCAEPTPKEDLNIATICKKCQVIRGKG